IHHVERRIRRPRPDSLSRTNRAPAYEDDPSWQHHRVSRERERQTYHRSGDPFLRTMAPTASSSTDDRQRDPLMSATNSIKQPLVRDMTAEDRDAVMALLVDSEPWTKLGYTKSDWEHYFAPLPSEREAFVMQLDGQVAGIAVIRQKFLLGDYLELFGVAKSARRTGLGTMLLAHVELVVFARAKNLFACVSDFNRSARKFYIDHGYQEIGSIPELIVSGSAEVLLRKTVGPARKS